MVTQTPILISVPHSGLGFPEETRSFYSEDTLKHPEDTDWFVDDLYDFADDMGIELIKAPYSRYVVDLNRAPDSQSLYDDGRGETSLIPTTTFSGKDILTRPLDRAEIQSRLDNYYWPHYQLIEKKLQERMQRFGQALLFDAHSIKRNVSTISDTPFPDMILGDRDKSTASSTVIDCALNVLGTGDYQVSHNSPFKGGNITRYFGNISDNIHALQLEMSQDIYMNEATTEYNQEKAEKVKKVLRPLFEELLVLLE